MVLILICLSACNEDEPLPDNTEPIDYGYTIDIKSPPEISIYSVGDTLPISIRFSSTTGEIVQNIGMKIYNKNFESIFLYSLQAQQHVPDFFEYNDYYVLKDTSKIEAGEKWILKAAMWSLEIGGDTISMQNEMLIRK